MKKIKGWIFECEIDKVLVMGNYGVVEIDYEHEPLKTKKQLLDPDSICPCDKNCKPIQVEISIRKVK